ncbi:MAG: rRNA pseudouridine synthase [Bacteroidales bacterium]|nr:rRNA pseudouridine synthase [Bacteroidales bacterium]
MTKEKQDRKEKRKKHGDYSAFYKKDKKPKKKQKPRDSGKPLRKPYEKKEADFKRKDDGLIRLNKYIADAGICSRREADKLIASGAVKVNGKIVSELGTKVSVTDKVIYGGEALKREKLRYLVLNKPRGFITTTDDPYERKTVMGLVEKACRERIYPLGRLDRSTTGVLLFTNDGDLAKKLLHPKHGIRKIYHVILDKNLTKADLEKVASGIELDDGIVKVDKISRVESSTGKKEVGLELHSGKNRIVRRIFESLGYKVARLDRVIFAGITKKDTPRGKWRMLSQEEVNMLKRLPGN